MSRRALVIEDERDIASLIKLHLGDVCDDVELAFDGKQGLSKALSRVWDLVILDLRLPGMDGLEICRRIREQQDYVPILMVTSKSSELDRVLGLEIGADDYITKPFSILELLARVKAVFRRMEAVDRESVPEPVKRIELPGLSVDTEQRVAKVNAQPVELTAKEFDLLLHFACHPGKVFTRSDLLDEVWGYGHGGYEHTVNSHINRLRAKIELDPANPRYIKTVWGVGYKFSNEADLANH